MNEALEKAFNDRVRFINNRSSAVFPVLLLSQEHDFLVTFLNYWQLKNGLNPELMRLNLWLYDDAGGLIDYQSLKIKDNHNCISIREATTIGKADNFVGSVNIEFVSLENLKFPFPAICGLYKSGAFYSAVHSAGRVLNSNEIKRNANTVETNWHCKFNEGVEPFFHYFRGPDPSAEKQILAKLHDVNGNMKSEKTIDVTDISVFGSKLYYAKALFADATPKEGDFVSVEMSTGAYFPRMVTGNIFSEQKLIEVTHSFQWIKDPDYCRAPQKKSTPKSILYLLEAEQLDLDICVFPTNCHGFYEVTREKRDKQTGAIITSQDNALNADDFNAGYHESIECSTSNWTLMKFYGERVPSRLNTSFRYKFADLQTPYSTDIADGADSHIYPDKYTHWGHGIMGEVWKSIILIRNLAHDVNRQAHSQYELTIYFSDGCKKISGNLPNGAMHEVALHDLCIDSFHSVQPISWMLKTSTGSCEAFWLAYNTKSGNVLGDHAF